MKISIGSILIVSFLILTMPVSVWAYKRGLVQQKTVLSDVYTVDKIYKSMLGPQSSQQVYLIDGDKPELLWIVGYEAVMKGADGKTNMSQEFMCHSNFDYRPWNHRQHFGKGTYANPRLFTLSQGQLEIHFPEGFGIPVISNEPLSLATQVLNHNIVGKTMQVRHQITIDFIRDKDLKEPLKSLFPTSAYGLILVEGEDGYYRIDNPDAGKHGPGCLPGKEASGNVYRDQFGRKFAGHWVVKPGMEINQTNVTKIMNLPYDTTIHYIAVHLHPYAESLELRDLTTNESLFKSNVRASKGKIGIDHVDFYSSKKGFPVYKDHEYEIVSTYNNTTDEDVDSMAVMYIYALDKDFKRPNFEE